MMKENTDTNREYRKQVRDNAPELIIENEEISKAWKLALKNLLWINTVPCPSEIYNRTGLLDEELGLMMRAGGTYPTPWTRDAAVNTMNAACFLEPEVAKNTLWAVCERTEGELCFQMDDQGWDKIIWAWGAWSYYLATGDSKFLKPACETVKNSLKRLEEAQFNSKFGLFTGGSFFNDGITGYPADLYEEGVDSSFVGDHRPVKDVMALSTNCLYYKAYCILERMENLLGNPEEAAKYAKKGGELKAAIQNGFWREEAGTYAYLLYPDGRRDLSQEGCGISFAVLTGICEGERAKKMIRGCYRSRRGLVSIWPPFEGISSVEKPLRHNNLIWPVVNGFFVTAAAGCGCADIVGDEIRNLALLVQEDGESYSEIYSPETGKAFGGWQCGHVWDSVRDQTWSATAMIRSLVFGVFGLEPGEKALRFHPCLPADFGQAALKGIRFGKVKLDLTLQGSGSRIKEIRIRKKGCDGLQKEILLAQPGEYAVEIRLEDEKGRAIDL